jgi:MerR family transcriptional regulator, repressor of the yfmOP operon
MDVKLITEEEYQHLLKKLEGIEETIKEKVKPREKFYTNEDLCRLFSISKRTLQSWRDRKLITYHKVNGIIFYSIDDINAFLQKNQIKAKGESL